MYDIYIYTYIYYFFSFHLFIYLVVCQIQEDIFKEDVSFHFVMVLKAREQKKLKAVPWGDQFRVVAIFKSSSNVRIKLVKCEK